MAKNCLRPENAPLNYIKGLCVNYFLNFRSIMDTDRTKIYNGAFFNSDLCFKCMILLLLVVRYGYPEPIFSSMLHFYTP